MSHEHFFSFHELHVVSSLHGTDISRLRLVDLCREHASLVEFQRLSKSKVKVRNDLSKKRRVQTGKSVVLDSA